MYQRCITSSAGQALAAPEGVRNKFTQELKQTNPLADRFLDPLESVGRKEQQRMSGVERHRIRPSPVISI